MEEKLNIDFDQLLNLVKQLPEKEKSILRASLEGSEERKKKETSKTALQKLILKAPVFSPAQIRKIKEARKQINKWRKI